MAGYAYIFTHPGVPCILYEHAFQKGMAEDIKKLAEIRRKNGINSKSKIKIITAQDDMCALQ
jgi:alpha-amylase